MLSSFLHLSLSRMRLLFIFSNPCEYDKNLTLTSIKLAFATLG